MTVYGLLGLAFALALVYLALDPAGTEAPAAKETAAAEASAQARRDATMAELVVQTRQFKGDPEAPVTILEYSDFQ